MNATPTVKLAEDRLRVLTMRALVCHGLREPAALACARKLVDADACGLESHGVARVPMYCRMLETGRIAGDAQPFLIDVDADAASAAVDADGGIGYDACDLAVRDLAPRARRHGIAFVGIRHSAWWPLHCPLPQRQCHSPMGARQCSEPTLSPRSSPVPDRRRC